MSLVPVTDLTCDGITYKCTGKLVRESHSPAYSWLKLEILGLGRRELGRPVEHRNVPPGSVQPGGGHRELSALNKKWQCLDEKLPLGHESLDRPASCQRVNLRWWFSQVHRGFGEQPPTWCLISSIDIHCLSCRSGVMGTGWHSGKSPSSTSAVSESKMSSPIGQVHSPSCLCDVLYK